MRFRSIISAGVEVLFIGHEKGNARPPSDWLLPGRWKISTDALDKYLTESLKNKSFGSSIDTFVFCLEIADFEKWGTLFLTTANYTSYKPKRKEIWSVGQLRWSDVKDLDIKEQLHGLRISMKSAIFRVDTKPRRPKDFNCAEFAAAIDALLEVVPENLLAAQPAT